jgi:hypothetical protein
MANKVLQRIVFEPRRRTLPAECRKPFVNRLESRMPDPPLKVGQIARPEVESQMLGGRSRDGDAIVDGPAG